MKWIKYRYRYASGPAEWEWQETEARHTEECQYAIEELSNDPVYTAHEHYRGIEFTLEDTAPRLVILRKLREYQRASKNYAERAFEMSDALFRMDLDTVAERG